MVIGIIGLGNLGLPIARRLASAGMNVLGYDISQAAREAAQGMTLTSSIKELSELADTVFVLVSNSSQCRSVLSGPDGIAAAATPPTAVVIMATVGPDAITDLAAPLLESGTAVIDAPVSGGAEAALNGELSLMIGGTPESLERCRSILATLGTLNIMGGLGTGQSAKLANQIVFFATQAALQEAVALAAADGVNLDALVQALGGGTADSWSVRHHGFLERTARYYDAAGVEPEHRPWHKDLKMAAQATAARGVEAPVTELISRVFGNRLDQVARVDKSEG